MKRTLMLCFVVILSLVFAQVSMASTGMGGRAMGMGGAFTAVADDGTAAYWNPAGLTQVKFVLSPTFGGLGDWSGFMDLVDKMGDMEGSDSYTELENLKIEDASMMVNIGAGLNFSRLALNLYTEPNISTSGLSKEKGDFRGNAPVVASVTYAQEFTDLLGLGVNLKGVYLARGTADYKEESLKLEYAGQAEYIEAPNGEVKYGTGMGFLLDLGGIFKVNDRVRVGAVLRNVPLGGTKLEGKRSRTDMDYLQEELDKADTEEELEEIKEKIEGGQIPVLLATEDYTETYQLPTVLVVGGAVKLPVTGTLVAADYEIPIIDDEDEAESSIHIGVEQSILGLLYLRVGGYTADDEFRLTGGLGGKLGPVLLDLAAVQGDDSMGLFLTGGFKF